MANLINQVFLNQYRVDEFIASGGMGAVYKVWDLKRNVPLAMKVLHADFADDPSSFKYFQREARALQKLRHPNVVPFYGLFQEGQTAFLLEHYIDGPSLRDILDNHKSGMPIPEALAYMQALCSALGYAHSSGVVHCDIKPANVMVDRGGQVYLADFGIARHAESSTTTIAGAGTPSYMAPEQINAKPVVPATDIYSLGVLLFELLAGQRPFRGDEQASAGKGETSGERVRYAHLHLPAPDPRSLNPSIPPALAEIVMKCMAKAPEDRYAFTGELLAALAMIGIAPAPRVQTPMPPHVPSKPDQPRPVQKTVQPQKNIPSILWISGIVVFGLIIIVVLGMIVFSIGKQTASTNTAGDQPNFPSVPQATEALSAIINQPSESAPIEPPMELPIETPIPTPTEIPPPTPAPLLSNYDLAFVSDRGGNLHPFVVNSNNPADYQSFDNPPGYEKTLWPTFCGGKLAVEASGNNQWIYMYDEAGQPHAWNHPKNASLLGIPRCSPNGQYLAYTAMADEYADIYIADVNSEVILHKPDSHSYGKLAVYTSWLGDSSSFIFEMVTKPSEIYLSVSGIPSSPTSPRQINLGSNGVLARFSPDGSQAAFSCDEGQLCVSNINSGSVKRIYQTTWNDKVTPDWIIKVSPVWSADGQWIYFASVEGEDWDILRIRPDGSELQNITEAWTSNEITPATR